METQGIKPIEARRSCDLKEACERRKQGMDGQAKLGKCTCAHSCACVRACMHRDREKQRQADQETSG